MKANSSSGMFEFEKRVILKSAPLSENLQQNSVRPQQRVIDPADQFFFRLCVTPAYKSCSTFGRTITQVGFSLQLHLTSLFASFRSSEGLTKAFLNHKSALPGHFSAEINRKFLQILHRQQERPQNGRWITIYQLYL